MATVSQEARFVPASADILKQFHKEYADRMTKFGATIIIDKNGVPTLADPLQVNKAGTETSAKAE